MTPRPILTLVVTAHRASFLLEALNSVRGQTTGHFELICCADTTGEAEIEELLSEFIASAPLPRCELVRVAGGTAGRVRNAGFGAAQTDWVSYLDGDDVLRPEAVARVLEVIQFGCADLICTGMSRLDRSGGWSELPDSWTYRPPSWIYRTDPDTVGHCTYFNQFLAMRRCLWRRYPFDESTNGEDIDFMLHQLLAGRFCKIPSALYGYRDTPGSFSERVFADDDICTRRYRSGYYSRLYARDFRPELAGNFLDDTPA